MVKAGRRDSAPIGESMNQPVSEGPKKTVLDDVDELIMCLDCEPEAKRRQDTEEIDILDDDDEELESPDIPDGSEEAGPVPWLDRYEATSHLIGQLEDTLKMMDAEGVNLTGAWELANTARSLLDSADVVQALIYANRSFHVARQVHRVGPSGVAAS